jgi:hypothetical protein
MECPAGMYGGETKKPLRDGEVSRRWLLGLSLIVPVAGLALPPWGHPQVGGCVTGPEPSAPLWIMLVIFYKTVGGCQRESARPPKRCFALTPRSLLATLPLVAAIGQTCRPTTMTWRCYADPK